MVMADLPLISELPFETRSDVRFGVEAELGPPQPHLFRVFECNHPLAPSARHCLAGIDSVAIGRGERRHDRSACSGRQLRIFIPDPWMSSAHALLFRRDGSWIVEDAGSRNGTLVNGRPVERAELGDGDVVELGRSFFLFRQEVIPSLGDPADLESSALPAIVAELASLSPALARQIHKLVQVADSQVSVVVQGETGTGKERVARAVHVLSRRPGEFVAVNCGALPATLIETELFGCRRGSFTGAQDRPGLIRTAERGTLFLDEIGDLPIPAQVALLRVLQEREVHPVGATHPVPVDFRLVCATQQPLDVLVSRGRFRSDLFARLAGVTVRLPLLCERREDLGMITATLLRRLVPGRPDSVVFDKQSARALLRHPFPLNIRELEKCLQSAIALAGGQPGQVLTVSLDAPPPVAGSCAATPPPHEPDDVSLRRRLVALLDLHRGNVSATARSMGKERVQIRRWLQRYQIDPARFRR
jgi:transcriptional regulator with AAA-type ATPase domain